MNWDALGAIGELVGAMAVVATLAYLAVQMRQNNKLSRATAVQTVSQQNLEFLGMLATNPDLRELWIKGAEDHDKLDARAKQGFYFVAQMLLRLFEEQHQLRTQGALPDEMWEASKVTCLRMLSRPGLRQNWEDNKFTYTASFRQHVDELLTNSDYDHSTDPVLTNMQEPALTQPMRS